jgi:hypothetical protein
VSDILSMCVTLPLTLAVLADLKRKEAQLAETGAAAMADVPV